MRVQIRLDTMSDAQKFVEIASRIPERITVTDGNDLRVSAKSLLGMLHAMEFEELWCECDKDIYQNIERFVVIG